jgi:two-component system NtrC family sensor kinase
MRLRLNLQWKVLSLVAVAMTVILLVSLYLHGLITRILIEDIRYNDAVGQTVAMAGRIAARDYFLNLEDLRQDIQLVMVSAHADFKQIDVYQSEPNGLRLVATAGADEQTRLPALDENTQDNELGEKENPLPGVVSIETTRDLHRYWLITAAIEDREGKGYVSALVLKNPDRAFLTSLQRQHNLVLGGSVVASVVLLYLLFTYFFRRPARDIVHAMALARAGDLGARAVVRREDELGEIARGFNRMIDEISERDREREKLLTQIRGFNDELRIKVDTATRELRAANDALFQNQQRLARSERLAAIGQVAASLAHEIGTPLNAISGHLKLLGRNHLRNPDTQRRVHIVNTQLDFIVGIVRSLLQRTHRRRLLLSPTDLNALVREVLWLVAPTLDSHSISVEEMLAPDLPPVRGDRDSLHQVFLNLINNSIDAMAGGGRLQITSRLDPAGDAAELIFRDTGGGIDPEALDHLFTPMWTTKASGGGFGLAIIREIMDEHEGQIEVLTQQGQTGAAFRLTLPLAQQPADLSVFEEEVTSGAA